MAQSCSSCLCAGAHVCTGCAESRAVKCFKNSRKLKTGLSQRRKSCKNLLCLRGVQGREWRSVRNQGQVPFSGTCSSKGSNTGPPKTGLGRGPGHLSTSVRTTSHPSALPLALHAGRRPCSPSASGFASRIGSACHKRAGTGLEDTQQGDRTVPLLPATQRLACVSTCCTPQMRAVLHVRKW